MKPVFSFILPILNEEETILETYRRLARIMDSLKCDSEVVLVDDGSNDRSLEMMRGLHQRDPRVRYISLARNFGHQIAVTAGLTFARGDAVIILDADLQDPPELIPTMIEKWRAGYHVVYAKHISRQRESVAKKVFAYVFYRFLRLLLPHGSQGRRRSELAAGARTLSERFESLDRFSPDRGAFRA